MRLEGMSSFCELEQRLNSLSSDDRIQEQPFLTGKDVQGFKNPIPTCAHYYPVFRNIIPVAARSKVWVCGHSLAAIAGLDPARGHGCLSSVCVVCCQVEVSVSG
jgi:hypothetical protein